MWWRSGFAIEGWFDFSMNRGCFCGPQGERVTVALEWLRSFQPFLHAHLQFWMLTETGMPSRPAEFAYSTSSCSYFLSSFTSAIRACLPAPVTAFTNASALFGVDALPERMARNVMCLP